MAVMLWAGDLYFCPLLLEFSFCFWFSAIVTVTYLGVIYFVFTLLGIAELLESVA